MGGEVFEGVGRGRVRYLRWGGGRVRYVRVRYVRMCGGVGG